MAGNAHNGTLPPPAQAIVPPATCSGNDRENKAMLHFLVALDESAHSIAAVRWVAQIAATGARLRCTLLHVHEPVMSGEVGAIAPASIGLGVRKRRAARIFGLASAILRPSGLRFATEEQMDDAATAVVARANALDCDAIVIGRPRLHRLRAAILGSVSTDVVRNSGVPVILIGARTKTVPMSAVRLLVAVDGSESAVRATIFASRLAAASSGELHLLHVKPSRTLASTIFGPREHLIEHWSGTHAKNAFAGVRGFLDRSHAKCTEHIVAHDDPRNAILSAAPEYACDFVAMGTRGLGPVTGLLMGSVAQGVLEQVPGAIAAVVLVR